MYSLRHIDWIAATFPKNVMPEDVFPGADWAYVGRGSHGQEVKLEDRLTGTIAEQGASDEKMGTHIVMSGKAIDTARSIWSLSDDEICAMVRAHKGRVSRVDLAVDVKGGRDTPQTLFRSLRDKKAHTVARSFSFTTGRDKGHIGSTLYVGGRQSDRFMRVYDKRAEMGMGEDKMAWIRYELELKGKVAHLFGKATTNNSVDALIVGHMTDFIEYNRKEYQRAMYGEAAEIESVGRKTTDGEAWLLRICAPALAKAVFLNEDFASDFMDEYIRVLRGYNRESD